MEAQSSIATFLKHQSDDPLLTSLEAAAVLNVKPDTLLVWRCTKRYKIPYIKVGRLVRYRRSDLEAWLESRTQNSGGE